MKKEILKREIYLPGSLRIREAGEGEKGEKGEGKEKKACRTIEGTAIVFGQESEPLYDDDTLQIREVIAPEAVTRELLDSSTILMTLYHDNGRLLARSRKGEGTLSYDVDESGVHFSFDAPDTEDGRVALEAIRRGDITGCSFAFTVDYGDEEAVERTSEKRNGKEFVLYTVRRMLGIHDFTLTPIPAYPQTETSEIRDITRAAIAAPEKADGKERSAWREKIDEIINLDI